jgi:hypothetical protein
VVRTSGSPEQFASAARRQLAEIESGSRSRICKPAGVALPSVAQRRLYCALWPSSRRFALVLGRDCTHPATFIGAAMLPIAVAAACYRPPPRAMRVDPISALRIE